MPPAATSTDALPDTLTPSRPETIPDGETRTLMPAPASPTLLPALTPAGDTVTEDAAEMMPTVLPLLTPLGAVTTVTFALTRTPLELEEMPSAGIGTTAPAE